MEWLIYSMLCFFFLLLLLFIGVPVAFSLSFVSLVAMYLLWGFDGLMTVASTAYSTNANFLLIAIPLFIFMGECVAISGVGADAFKVIDAWFGRLPGGLAITAVGCCTIFGAVTGFAPATTSALGPAIIPELLKRKYDKALGLGAIAGGSGLAVIIPPSIPMVIYGFLAEVSIGRLFYGGLFPGLLVALIFGFYIMGRVMMNPSLAPRDAQAAPPFLEKIKKSLYILPFFGLIFLVLGTIWGGVAAPSEAAAMGAVGSIVLLVYYKRLTWGVFKQILLATVRVNCMVMYILIGGILFTQILVELGFAKNLTEFVISLDVSKWVIFVIMQVLVLIGGCFLDPASLLFISIPIFLPIIKTLGFDLYWFGVLTVINIGIAPITPPVGVVLYVLKGVSPPEISLQDIMLGSAPYWLLYLIGMLPVVFFPELVTWLPSLIIQ
ncbi:MAG: TRAP transporter large permease subunit [Deltaproteobacteria bacterium]|nr:TRAP transporter large permease subunit [Deltaproteobacteria bacterium]